MKVLPRTTAVAIVLVIAVTIPAYAATWTVCSSGCDFASIQMAVDLANDGDSIELGAETFYENVTVGKDLTIRGAGPDRTIVDGGAGAHVFLHTLHSLSLSDMTVRNADVGIQSGGHALNIDNCVVSENSTGVRALPIFSEIITEVVITTTMIDGTELSGSGSCIRNEGASATIEGSTITGCTKGVYTTGALIGEGNYDYFIRGATEIKNTTITGNGTGVSVKARCFGISTGPSCPGIGADTSVVDSTIADQTEWGVRTNRHFTCTYTDCFVSLNFEGSLVTNSGFGNCLEGVAAPLVGVGANLSSDDSCPWDGSIDPMLLPLANNGGPTPTHALHPDSPAIDAGGDDCETTDQRGVSRPQDGDEDGVAKCDFGAFEFVTTTALLSQLIDHIESLNLPNGTENSLLAKLNAALLVLTAVPTGNDHAAVNILGAFVNTVEAQRGKKIAAADADVLIDVAEEIIGLLTISGQAFEGVDSIRTIGFRSHRARVQRQLRNAEEPE